MLFGVQSSLLSMNGSDYQKFSAYQRIWSITVRFLVSTALNSKIREKENDQECKFLLSL